jgi:hypothetical protein
MYPRADQFPQLISLTTKKRSTRGMVPLRLKNNEWKTNLPKFGRDHVARRR